MGQTVLIVDDNVQARAKLRQELQAHGWSVLESPIKMDAAELAKHQAPDLVILNAAVPDLRVETVARVLKLEAITCAIPIIALTVTDPPERPSQPWVADTIHPEHSLAVTLAKLQHALAKQKGQKPYVLVVDDEPRLVEILTAFLNEAGMAASGALNGREALEVVRSVQPDAILLDVDMPSVDGWEVLARLKAKKALANIRVVILTGAAQTEADQQRAKAMGASAYLRKPCDMRDVLQAIHSSLENP